MSHLSFARRRFGLRAHVRPANPAHLSAPAPGEMLVLIGPCGAGKTRALNALCARTGGRRSLPLTRQQLCRPVLSLLGHVAPSQRALRLLCACGLADATLWTRRAGTLSAGEMRRLEIALALSRHEARAPLILDEFDAHLDLEAALALAASLRRICAHDALPLALSTHRPELLPVLAPARVIEMRRGRAHERPDLAAQPVRDLLAEVTVRKGRLAEYAPFSHWHYLGAGRPGPVTDVFVAEFARRPIAIAVFCAPHLFLGPRNLLLPRFSSNRVAELGAGALNANLRLLSRIVVEPAFRGMGVAAKLLREALPALGVRYVECLAEMGEFSGFLVRAGFERKGQVKPSREARSLIKTLERLGLRERELADPALRREIMARLNSRTRARLLRQLAGLCRSRVQTGKGSLRGRACSAGEEVLQRALWRLRCRPEYFLWERP